MFIFRTVLAIHKSAGKFGALAMKKYFGALAEIGELGPTFSSIELARKIRYAAENTTTCKLRAIASRTDRQSISQF